MEKADRELIELMMRNDVRLKRLYEEHAKLETRLAEFAGRSFLTSSEQREERELKKKKLSGVDEMMRRLASGPPKKKRAIQGANADQQQAAA